MFPLILAGANAALAALGASSQNQITEAGNRVRRAQADASNRVRDAGNGFNLARTTQARQLQVLNNNRITADMGAGLESQARNYARQKDLQARGSFEDNIREAEVMGEQAALAALGGAGGDAVDVVSGTTALRNARAEEEQRRNYAQSDFDYAYTRGAIVTQALSGLDGSTILDDIDYGIDVAQIGAKTSVFGTALSSFVQSGGLQALAGTDFGSLFKAKPAVGGNGFRAPGALSSDQKYSFSFLPKESSTAIKF